MAQPLDGDMVRLSLTQGGYSVTAPMAGLIRWTAGELIQDALPDLTLDQREFLISGLDPDEFDALSDEEDTLPYCDPDALGGP